MIRLTFLGTAAARPTVGRNVSGLAVQREGDLFLFDCGEGTQRQMMRFQSGFGDDALRYAMGVVNALLPLGALGFLIAARGLFRRTRNAPHRILP